jgi:hypothetical protein
MLTYATMIMLFFFHTDQLSQRPDLELPPPVEETRDSVSVNASVIKIVLICFDSDRSDLSVA